MKRPSLAALAWLLSSGALVATAFADERIEDIVHGTPVSCGDERMRLHGLSGKSVIVTLIRDKGAVARAIQVAETEAC